MSIEFLLTTEQRHVRNEARKLARSFDYDYWYERDTTAKYPWEFVQRFAAAGWLGIIVPEEYGGGGGTITDAALMLNEVAASGAGATGASALHFYVFPAMPIVRHGSEEMKQRVLPLVAKGELLMAFGVTEPNAGIDTSRIRTRAEKVGNKWVITGQKVWTTNAQNASHILILARTSPRDESRPMDGMTLFFVPLDREKCRIREIPKMGRAAIDSNEVFIDGLEAADHDVVGEVGSGFRYLLDGLNPERIVTAMEGIGIGRAALELAVRYAKERVVFDRPIGQNQAIAHPLAQSWVELEGAELAALRAAWLYDNGQPCGAEANAAKFLSGAAGSRATDAALQTHGGFGYSKEYHVERLMREAQIFKITPITQQMVLNYVSAKVLGLPRSY
ncbi:acyl-CoA dehydrogenase family protein [Saccharomonospora sp. NPDC046836]|uniref:acyl-CoA dehydrogenase family protein n=1 Tax=Saccharomonospora sp. NPDC046836 TaxID=3156921 RepID=UPI0033E930B8